MKSILKFLMFLLIMLPVYAQSQEPAPAPLKASKEQQNKPTPKQAESKDHQYGTDNLPFVVKIVRTEPTAQKEKDNTRNSNNKSSSDWWKIIFDASLVIFNGLLAAFTWGLFISTRKMWKSTEKAANAAKDAAEALPLVERAYIFVTIEVMEPKPHDNVLGDKSFYDFRANIRMYNYGKTPAIVKNIRKEICLERVSISESDKLETPAGIFLGNNGDAAELVKKTISGDQLNKIDTRNMPVFCYGRIKYQDIFKKWHETGFCWEYRIISIDKGGKWVESGKYKEMNYYD